MQIHVCAESKIEARKQLTQEAERHVRAETLERTQMAQWINQELKSRAKELYKEKMPVMKVEIKAARSHSKKHKKKSDRRKHRKGKKKSKKRHKDTDSSSDSSSDSESDTDSSSSDSSSSDDSSPRKRKRVKLKKQSSSASNQDAGDTLTNSAAANLVGLSNAQARHGRQTSRDTDLLDQRRSNSDHVTPVDPEKIDIASIADDVFEIKELERRLCEDEERIAKRRQRLQHTQETIRRSQQKHRNSGARAQRTSPSYYLDRLEEIEEKYEPCDQRDAQLGARKVFPRSPVQGQQHHGSILQSAYQFDATQYDDSGELFEAHRESESAKRSRLIREWRSKGRPELPMASDEDDELEGGNLSEEFDEIEKDANPGPARAKSAKRVAFSPQKRVRQVVSQSKLTAEDFDPAFYRGEQNDDAPSSKDTAKTEAQRIAANLASQRYRNKAKADKTAKELAANAAFNASPTVSPLPTLKKKRTARVKRRASAPAATRAKPKRKEAETETAKPTASSPTSGSKRQRTAPEHYVAGHK